MIYVVATEHERKLAEELGAKEVIVTGVGGINAIRALKDVPRDEAIYNVGYVGSNVLDVGTWAKVGRVQIHRRNVEYDEEPIELTEWAEEIILGGTSENGDFQLVPSEMEQVDCYTSSDFVLETDIEEPVVFDMELAYIAAMGFREIYALKKVSDNLSLHEYEKNAEGEIK